MPPTEQPEAPDVEELADELGLEGEQVQQIGAIARLFSAQPILGLLAAIGMGGSVYFASLVDEALDKHEADHRAHDIDRIEARLEALEAKVDDTHDDVGEAVRLLRQRSRDLDSNP